MKRWGVIHDAQSGVWGLEKFMLAGCVGLSLQYHAECGASRV